VTSLVAAGKLEEAQKKLESPAGAYAAEVAVATADLRQSVKEKLAEMGRQKEAEARDAETKKQAEAAQKQAGETERGGRRRGPGSTRCWTRPRMCY